MKIFKKRELYDLVLSLLYTKEMKSVPAKFTAVLLTVTVTQKQRKCLSMMDEWIKKTWWVCVCGCVYV